MSSRRISFTAEEYRLAGIENTLRSKAGYVHPDRRLNNKQIRKYTLYEGKKPQDISYSIEFHLSEIPRFANQRVTCDIYVSSFSEDTCARVVKRVLELIPTKAEVLKLTWCEDEEFSQGRGEGAR